MIAATKQKWRTVTKLLRDISYEGELHFDDGIHTQIITPDNVLSLNLEVEPSYFEEFTPSFDTLSVDFTDFDKSFNRFRKKEQVRLSVDDKGYVWHSSDRKKFSMREIDINSRTVNLKDFSLSAEFTVSQESLLEALEDAEYVVGEDGAVEFTISSDGVVAEAGEKTSGGFKGDVTQTVTTENSFVIKFGVEILLKILEALSDVETLTVRCGKNQPMVIEHSDDDMSIKAIIAPMVR